MKLFATFSRTVQRAAVVVVVSGALLVAPGEQAHAATSPCTAQAILPRIAQVNLAICNFSHAIRLIQIDSQNVMSSAAENKASEIQLYSDGIESQIQRIDRNSAAGLSIDTEAAKLEEQLKKEEQGMMDLQRAESQAAIITQQVQVYTMMMDTMAKYKAQKDSIMTAVRSLQ